MTKILICDPLNEAGLEALRESGAEVDILDPEDRPQLTERVGDYDAIVVRSGTTVTREILEAGRPRLRVVGRAGIGVDNVDVQAATELGILVVNAPTANMISATEHTFALLLTAARKVAAADASMRRGEWDRKGYQGLELQGKKLGVVGFGRIGQRVASRAQAFEMQILAYDPFLDPAVAKRLGVKLLELDEVLAQADVVTLHTPLTDQTRGLISAERIALMKPGALLINCGRGGIVDEEALLAALDDGRLAGAALDVFAQEPPPNLDLVKHPKVVSTPHIGAQTREAQERIGTQTAEMMLAALDGSLAVTAVNLPFRPATGGGEEILLLGERLGQLASTLLGKSFKRLKVDLWGIDEGLQVGIGIAALKGALEPFLKGSVNYVNAEGLARDRGLSVVRSVRTEGSEYTQLVRISLTTADEESVSISGTLFRDNDLRVVQIGGFQLEFRLEGKLLVIRNRDVPGVVGRLGSLMGEAGVNIAGLHLSRNDSGPQAMAVFLLDHVPSAEVLERVAAMDEIDTVQFVDLGSR